MVIGLIFNIVVGWIVVNWVLLPLFFKCKSRFLLCRGLWLAPHMLLLGPKRKEGSCLRETLLWYGVSMRNSGQGTVTAAAAQILQVKATKPHSETQQQRTGTHLPAGEELQNYWQKGGAQARWWTGASNFIYCTGSTELDAEFNADLLEPFLSPTWALLCSFPHTSLHMFVPLGNRRQARNK